MPDGRKKPVSFSEAQQIYCRFPVIDKPDDHDAAAAKEDRDFQRWQQFGVMPNSPDNLPENGEDED
jgi:hypothetical protein